MAYQFLRGTTAQNDAYTGPEGSFTIDLDKNEIRLHDGVTAGGGATIRNAAAVDTLLTNYAQTSNNLSDLDSASSARTNLGLGTAATEADTKYAHRTNNLSDLGSPATARTNLGLGSAAVNDDSEYVRTDEPGTISSTLTVVGSMNVRGPSNRHFYFRDELDAEQSLIWHDEGAQALRMRLRNGGGTLSQLSLYPDGDVEVDTGRFVGNGSGLTNLDGGSVRDAISSSPTGGVGTYAFLENNSGGGHNPGDTESGSNLNYGGSEGSGSTQPASTSTWKCMGRALVGERSLYLRLS